MNLKLFKFSIQPTSRSAIKKQLKNLQLKDVVHDAVPIKCPTYQHESFTSVESEESKSL